MKNPMWTCCAILIALALFGAVSGCKKKERNEVPLEQIENDRSTNYRFIFRKTIDRETEKSRKDKKDPFIDKR